VLQIVRKADFVLANQEGTAFDYKSMPWIQGSGMFPMDSRPARHQEHGRRHGDAGEQPRR
jgi:hypothetical protein